MTTYLRKSSTASFLLVILTAFILVCTPGVLQRSIWTDEAYSMLILSGEHIPSFADSVTIAEHVQNKMHARASIGQTINTLINDDIHPPVYFVLAKAWSTFFGQSLLSLRWMSVVTGTLAIAVFFQFLKLYSRNLAIVATSLFAFSTAVLHYSAEARFYIVSLLGLVTILYLLATISKGHHSWYFRSFFLLPVLAIITALTFLTNYLAIVSMGVCYIWFCLDRSNWRAGMLSGAVALLLMSIWLPFLFEHNIDGQNQSLGLEGLSRAMSLFELQPDTPDPAAEATGWLRHLHANVVGTFGSFYIASHIDYPTLLHWLGRFLLFGLIALGAISGLRYASTSEDKWNVGLFVLLVIVPAIGMSVLSLFITKDLSELRYRMLAAPGLAALCGLGIIRVYQISARMGLVAWGAALLFLLSVANWGYSTSYFQGKTIYREFSRLLQREDLANSLVIAGTGPMPGNTAALFYELPGRAKVVVLQLDTDVDRLLSIAAPYEHIWLVRVFEKTREVETQLANSLALSGRNKAVFHQIEHYE
jgi:uncharacterized membrane protein